MLTLLGYLDGVVRLSLLRGLGRGEGREELSVRSSGHENKKQTKKTLTSTLMNASAQSYVPLCHCGWCWGVLTVLYV